MRTAQMFPDKFPGDPSSKGVDARVLLNVLLQEHSYLATMTTDAAAAQRTNEQSGAAAALNANADALGKLFAEMSGAGAGTQIVQLWGARNSDLIAYATSGDVAARQNLAEKFITRLYGVAPRASDSARDQVLAMIRVIDDQRAKNFKLVAGDDLAAAAGMQAVADQIGGRGAYAASASAAGRSGGAWICRTSAAGGRKTTRPTRRAKRDAPGARDNSSG